MKTRARKRLPARSAAGKRRAVKSSPAKSKARPKKAAAKSPNIRALARRWFEELWNKRNADALFELMDPAASGHSEGGPITGREDFLQKLHAPLLGAFPDLRVVLDDIMVEGNSAAVRWTLEATHGGDTLGIPASNRRVSVSGMTWMRYKNGKLIEGWDRWNAGGLMTYLREGTACATVRLPA